MPSSQVVTPIVVSPDLDIESLHKQLTASIATSAPLPYVRISFADSDAQEFLQGQLTLDLRQLDHNSHRVTAWCNAKGRVWAVLRIWRSGGGFEVLVPANQAEAFIKRMRMFVLRAQVSITPHTDVVQAHIEPGDQPDGALTTTSQATVLHHGSDHRLVVAAQPDAQDEHAQARYQALRILNAEPHIDAQTQEKFLPQSLGLSELGGLHFNKGCYVGQEIVARVHYRGKAPQRLNFALDPSDHALEGKAVLSDVRIDDTRIVQWVENIKA